MSDIREHMTALEAARRCKDGIKVSTIGDTLALMEDAQLMARALLALSGGEKEGGARTKQLEEAVSLADNYLRTIHPTGVADGDYICVTIRNAFEGKGQAKGQLEEEVGDG